MAHMIDFSNNRANMAYVGNVPWHGLGQQLPPGLGIEEWRIAAGLNWTYERSAVKFTVKDESDMARIDTFPNRFILHRSDTKAPLSIVSDRFQVVQPGEVLEFFRDLVDAGGFELETAGVLKGGERIWALAKTGHETRILGQDAIKGYLLLITSVDTQLATTAFFTNVRVVCNNTLELSVNVDGSGRVKVPHSRTFDPVGVKQDLGLLDAGWTLFEEQVGELAKRRVTVSETKRWLIDTFGDVEKPLEEQPNIRLMKPVFELFNGRAMGSNLRSADHTAWGLVCAATEFMDHHRPARSTDNRLNSAWTGTGAEYKRKAWGSALKLVA